jgi:adenylate cyclase
MPPEQRATRKLRAIFSADVKGYSILMGDDEAFTIKTLKAYRNIMSGLIKEHNGRVVDSPGDNVLAEFASVVDAVTCATNVQKVLQVKNKDLPDDKKLAFRIGVNIGDIVQDGNRIYGNGVNVAARIEGLAEPGGVSISRNAYGQIKDKLTFGYEYIGEHEVKNIKYPIRVYKVLMGSENAGKLVGDEPRRPRKKWFLPLSVVAAIVATSIGWYFSQNIMKSDIEPASIEKMVLQLPDKLSIAVLPFVNMSNDPEQEYFSDGMTDELISDLAKIKDVFVISRNSAFTYKGKSMKIQQIAKDLNVRYILEGSVQKSENHVRIRAQLIDGKTDRHLWAESYDGTMDDIFALQDKITGKIVSALAIKLTSSEQERLSDKGTDNILAYNTFLKGQEHAARLTGKNMMKAIDYFKEAVQIDPDFRRAYAALAGTYWLITTHAFSRQLGLSAQNDFPTLRLKARHYLELSMKDPASHAYRIAANMSLYRRQHDEAVSFAENAVSIAPNEFSNNLTLGTILTWAGRADEALVYIEKAIKLDPRWIEIKLGEMGFAHFIMGNYEKAVEFAQRCLTLNPGLSGYASFTAASYAFLNQQKEAEKAWNIFKDSFPEGTFPTAKFMYGQSPYKDHKVFDRFIEGLVKAGFKGDPSDYYIVNKKNKLNGQEIKKLIFGKVISGYSMGNKWAVKTSRDGELESPNRSGGIDKGKSWIEGDVICNRYETRYDGLKYCMDVYLNPEGDEISKSEYLALSDFGLYPFSVEKLEQ